MLANLLSPPDFDLVVIGGGASGFMASIEASENGVKRVCILEASINILGKVLISGGGRCNITNAVWDNKDLVTNYPRGQKPLLGPFSSFSTLQAFNWFEERGLKLSIEKDGRVFPSTNSSSDVIACLENQAVKSGVLVNTRSQVVSVELLNSRHYLIKIKNNQPVSAENVLLATGGSPTGRNIAKKIGHTVINPVPSLFSFSINNREITDCSGITVSNVSVTLNTTNKKYIEKGNILITHKGFSGPTILRLSAFGAISLNEDSYKAKIKVNWISKDFDEVAHDFSNSKKRDRSKLIINSKPYLKLPRRLWLAFVKFSGIPFDLNWSHLTKEKERKLIQILINSDYQIIGKGPYGEEFVTAGGVSLDEVDLKTMESKKFKGLYFAGEILNIDGVTGGFNFQHCWSSGWIAGNSVSKYYAK